jgi:Glucosyl transferase GtrII
MKSTGEPSSTLRLKPFGLLAAIFVLAYLFDLTHFSLSIDDESWAFFGSAAEWISQGRWPLYLIDQLFLPQPILPFLPIACFGAFCCAGYLLLIGAAPGRLPQNRDLALFPVFCAFPTWSFLTVFKTNVPGAGLALFCGCLAAYYFRGFCKTERRTPREWALLFLPVGILGATAIGCYQSFVLFLAVSFFSDAANRFFEHEDKSRLSREAGLACGLIFASLVLYWGITEFFLKVTGVSIHYVDSYFHPEVFWKHPVPVTAQTVLTALKVYSGSPEVYGRSCRMVGVLILAASLSLWFRTRRYGLLQGSFLTLVFLGTILLIPFGLHFLSGGNMPSRILVAVPAAIWSVIQLGATDAPVIIRRYSLPVILIFTIWPIAHVRSVFHAEEELAALHDQALAVQLATRISALNTGTWSNASGVPTRIDVFGGQPIHSIYPVVESSTIGASFFDWDGGNPIRISSYMNLLGYPHSEPAPGDRARDHLTSFAGMPEWPAPGSVQLAQDGTVLIKLSDKPGKNYEPLLTSEDPESGKNPPFFRWATKEAPVSLTRGAQLSFQTGEPAALRPCGRLQIHASIVLRDPHRFVLSYWKPDGKFREREVLWYPTTPGPSSQLYLQLVSANGFEDSFRLTPIGLNDTIRVEDIQLACLDPGQ